ncbi:signal transduction histidine kinase/DNA-binding NarL/FixJ family response regulator [Dokdonella fugitiva]|uniref:Sensory/regulatory protein RpfC n=1 Tax=Dokdonella fugitiva TaxID=328517 RepID=A0A839F575_9GAMM|nr:sensor histidine kinase [Dokdonella fugitiva]MBA8887341.1 signal transduction histidine kinase/DNA-binding NarL/FixJ family response regulator [Dokdonella fugitiva]
MIPLYRRVRIRVQLQALFGLLLLTGLTVLVLDEINQRSDVATFQSVQRQSLAGLRLAKSISDAYGLDIVSAVFRVRNNLMGWDQGVEVVEGARRAIDRDWKELVASELPPEQRAVVDEIARARVSADRAAEKLLAIFHAADIGALGRFADTELYPAMDPVASRLKFLADLKMFDTERMIDAHLDTARRVGRWRVILSLITLAIVLVVGRSMLRNIYKGVESLKHLARHARERDYEPGGHVPDGELGEVHEALSTMRQDLLRYEGSLRESEARAQAASRAKSSFLASMSHEIRTPMVGVASMLELLARTDLDADQRQQVEIVQGSAQSLLQIIGDILDFSKIEAGRLELMPVPVDLRELVRASTGNFLATASAKGLRLDCTIDARLAPAHLADPLRLRQILSNFLSNALKFTERGSVVVALDRLAAAGHRELVALRVRDSGIGIGAEDQARLFQPFVQARDGGAQRADGSGLGLTICRRLAELMGGEITVESRLGVGTTMSLVVQLPLADATAAARASPAASVPARVAPSIDEAERTGRLILLVDDHPTNRAVISRQLRQLGYACDVAGDGESALERWRAARYALLLTDLHMPRRDGYSLAEAVRADERAGLRPRRPIVAMSANVSTEEVERSRAAGIDDFIAKPAPLQLLAAALQRYLPFDRAATSAPTVAPLAVDADLLRDYVGSTRQDLAALAAAVAARDAGAIAREAHRIKGASGLVGADAVATRAAQIENAAHASPPAPMADDLAELGRLLDDFAGAHGVESPR